MAVKSAPGRRDHTRGHQERQSAAEEEREPDEARLARGISVLLNFPSTLSLFVPPGVPCHKLDSFLNMYKTHCRNLLGAASCSEYDSLHLHLSHFWHELPEHLTCILESDFVANVIETCDMLFYEVCIPFVH